MANYSSTREWGVATLYPEDRIGPSNSLYSNVFHSGVSVGTYGSEEPKVYVGAGRIHATRVLHAATRSASSSLADAGTAETGT